MICSLLTLGGILCADGKSVTLDLRPSGKIRRLATQTPAPKAGTLRAFNLDAGTAEVGEVTVGDELSVTLFDDVTLTLTLKEQMHSPVGGDVFLAEVAGYEGIKTAVVLHTEDGLTVDIRDYLRNRVYKVISTSTGVTVKELEPPVGLKCGVDAHAAASRGETTLQTVAIPSTIPKNLRKTLSATSRSGTFVDILGQ